MRQRITTPLILAVMLAGFLVVAPHQTAVADSTVKIVALGDSYTAGNGALDYEDRTCFRSANAYVHHLAKVLNANSYSAASSNFACNGAKTGDIAGQIANAGSKLANADLAVLTIGGNDGNFGDIVVNCLAYVTRHFTLCHDNVNQVNSIMGQLLTDVRDAVVSVAAAAPEAEIVLVGYPQLVEACHTDFNLVRSLISGIDAQYQLLVNEINKTPWLSAGRVHYASMIKPFEGGGVCGDGPQLIRGTLDTSPTNYEEWWHPNVQGHAKIASMLYNKRSDYGISKSTEPPPPKPPSPPSGDYKYGNLPLACGTTVARATTYGTFTLNGTTFSHGEAVDFPVEYGTEVIAPASGRISVLWDGKGYGRFVDIVDGSGTTHRLAHMQESVSVSNGSTVKKGQLIGRVGTTGATTGPHLHYEQRKGSTQVKLALDGPTLVWSQPSGSDGDIYTLHSLTSANCGKPSHFDEVKLHVAPGGEIREILPSGKTKKLVGGISAPRFRVECDLDGNGLDEMYSVEYRKSKWFVMQAKIRTIESRIWREYKRFDKKTVKGLSCGDANGNGKDELKAHLAPGGEIRKIGYKRSSLLVKGISPPLFRVECDINGDGRDEIYSLERKGHLEYRLMQANFNNSLTLTSWRRYVHDKHLKGRVITAMSCGDRDANGRDEVKLFFKDKNGIYRIGHKSNINYRKPWRMWDGLTNPSFMLECDVNNDGVDEIYSVEYRQSRWYIMQGTWGKAASLKAWKQFAAQGGERTIKGLSCGNRNGS